jgi:hypothetical protein
LEEIKQQPSMQEASGRQNETESLAVPQEALEKIRQKTFNDELRLLVDNITAQPSDSSVEDQSHISSMQLLKKFHTLFYKSIHLSHLKDINQKIDTALVYEDVSEKVISNKIDDYFENNGVKEYALLFFSVEKKAYIPYLWKITSISREQCIIYPAEQLFHRILGSEQGLLLDKKAYRQDADFLHHFGDISFTTGNLYFLSLKHVIGHIYDTFTKQRSDSLDKILLPLLIMRYDSDTIGDVTHWLHSMKQEAALLLYFFSIMREKNISDVPNWSPSYVNAVLDTFTQIHSHNPDSKVLIITHTNLIDYTSYLLMKYIYGKLKKIVSATSSVLFLEREKIILFLDKKNYTEIIDYLSSLTTTYETTFTIQEIQDYTRKNLFMFLQT